MNRYILNRYKDKNRDYILKPDANCTWNKKKKKKEKKKKRKHASSSQNIFDSHTSRRRTLKTFRLSSKGREKQRIRTIHHFSPTVFFSTTRLFTTNDPTSTGKILEPGEETTRRAGDETTPSPQVQAIRSNARNERKWEN